MTTPKMAANEYGYGNGNGSWSGSGSGTGSRRPRPRRPAQMSAVQCLGGAGISKMQPLARNLFARSIRSLGVGWSNSLKVCCAKNCALTGWAGLGKDEYALTICQVKSQIQPNDFSLQFFLLLLDNARYVFKPPFPSLP